MAEIEDKLKSSEDGAELQQTLEELRRSERRYRRLVESSPEALFVFRGNTVVLANEAAGRLLETSYANLLFGRDVRDIVAPAWHEIALKQLRVGSGEECELPTAELEFACVDGATVFVEVSAMPFVYTGGQAVQWVVRDISERKKAGEAMRRQNEYLTALNEMAMGLVRRLDLGSVLTAILRRAAALINAPNWFLFIYNEEDDCLELQVGAGLYEKYLGLKLKPGEALAGKVFQEGKPLIVPNYRDWPERNFDPGLDVIRSVVGIPLQLDSHPIGVIGLGYFEVIKGLGDEEMDMLNRFGKLACVALYNARLYEHLQEELAERRSIEAELMYAKDLAEAANRAKSDFVANMSHELRTPLNAIVGFTELLKDGHIGPLNETQKEYLGDVHNAGRHLLSLINDILDLSKIESGKMELDLTEARLGDLFERSLAMVKQSALRHGIDLHADLGRVAEVSVRIDERKLKQILYNLLSNAVKFTPDRGEIWVRAALVDGREPESESGSPEPLEKGGKRVEVSVSDTGIGIVAKDIKKIFRPFEQADGSLARNYPGTGLGLSLTKRLVELHGGTIRVESAGADKGSTFYFTLPCPGKDALAP